MIVTLFKFININPDPKPQTLYTLMILTWDPETPNLIYPYYTNLMFLDSNPEKAPALAEAPAPRCLRLLRPADGGAPVGAGALKWGVLGGPVYL